MNTEYIYGDSNGAVYRDVTESEDGKQGSVEAKTHWDPRIEVDAIAHRVQVGVVPASERSTNDGGLWDRAEGQFLSLDRAGCNRLIRSIRAARDEMFGRDE